MNACGERGSGLLVFSFAGGFVSYTSLWNGSTDFHTHCETATKLEKEIDGDGNGKMLSSEDFLPLYISPPSSFPLCLSLAFSPSVLFSGFSLMNF